MELNIFELASKRKLRFPSIKGDLTTEQLWDLSLTSKSGLDLDAVAKTVNAELKATAEESFVAVSTNPRKAELELKLEIVKHIIAIKMQAATDAQAAERKRAEHARLTQILGQKEDAALEALSADEIRARLAALNA